MIAPTPGPWYSMTSREVGPPLVMAGDVAAQTGFAVAIIARTAGYNQLEQCAANAALIAAAPDLLAACREAEIKFAEYAAIHAEKNTKEGNAKMIANLDMVVMLRKAIGKAVISSE